MGIYLYLLKAARSADGFGFIKPAPPSHHFCEHRCTVPPRIEALCNVGIGEQWPSWPSNDLTLQRTADLSKDDPHNRCQPDNYPRTYWLPQRVFDWEVAGNTFVITTKGFRESEWLDTAGDPITVRQQ